jgi:RNA polymerase sigma factor (sigma-70 family)
MSAFERLTEKEKECFKLYHIGNLSQKDIEKKMKISQAQVSRTIAKAENKIRLLINQQTKLHLFLDTELIARNIITNL